MKLREYIAHLQDIIDENPSALGYDVLYYDNYDELYPVDNAPEYGHHDHNDPSSFRRKSIRSNCVCVN